MALSAAGTQRTYGSATVTLPHGLWLDGACYRQAGLRPLAGDDEAFLVEAGNSLLPAQRTTALLVRCLTALDTLDLDRHDPETLVRRLTVGDREALLLHLRRLTFGERLHSVLACPQCERPMDLELRVSDVLQAPYAGIQERHEALFDEDGVQWQVCFRLPAGADQEAAAAVAQQSPQAGGELILRRCVLEMNVVGGQNKTDSGTEELPDVVRHELPALLARLDPQAEIQLDLVCPECGAPFAALFDTAAFFFQEIGQRSVSLYREVGILASYYHWSETEIMRMSTTRRQRYVELLQEALGS